MSKAVIKFQATRANDRRELKLPLIDLLHVCGVYPRYVYNHYVSRVSGLRLLTGNLSRTDVLDQCTVTCLVHGHDPYSSRSFFQARHEIYESLTHKLLHEYMSGDAIMALGPHINVRCRAMPYWPI